MAAVPKPLASCFVPKLGGPWRIFSTVIFYWVTALRYLQPLLSKCEVNPLIARSPAMSVLQSLSVSADDRDLHR